jgi:glycine cleavage system transcriptional repressor
MEKVAVTVLGTDRPGIVYEVSSLLSQLNCNIEDISQTVLEAEFAGIFLISLAPEVTLEGLDALLQESLTPNGLYVVVKKISGKEQRKQEDAASFVVISIGPDKTGLVASFTKVMTAFDVNITQLKFIHKSLTFPEQSVAIYEVDIPGSIILSRFVEALKSQAKQQGVEVSVQHKKIFEDICRI